MLSYEGSLDALLSLIFELEAHGQIGPHITNLFVQDARWAREDGYQTAESGEPAAIGGLSPHRACSEP